MANLLGLLLKQWLSEQKWTLLSAGPHFCLEIQSPPAQSRSDESQLSSNAFLLFTATVNLHATNASNVTGLYLHYKYKSVITDWKQDLKKNKLKIKRKKGSWLKKGELK